MERLSSPRKGGFLEAVHLYRKVPRDLTDATVPLSTDRLAPPNFTVTSAAIIPSARPSNLRCLDVQFSWGGPPAGLFVGCGSARFCVQNWR